MRLRKTPKSVFRVTVCEEWRAKRRGRDGLNCFCACARTSACAMHAHAHAHAHSLLTRDRERIFDQIEEGGKEGRESKRQEEGAEGGGI